MRKLILGLVGAGALGLAALAPTGASAQSFSITIGSGYEPVQYYGYPPPRYGHRHWRDRHHDRRWRHGRYVSQRCVTRVERYWDGFGWVKERRRICR